MALPSAPIVDAPILSAARLADLDPGQASWTRSITVDQMLMGILVLTGALFIQAINVMSMWWAGLSIREWEMPVSFLAVSVAALVGLVRLMARRSDTDTLFIDRLKVVDLQVLRDWYQSKSCPNRLAVWLALCARSGEDGLQPMGWVPRR